MSKTTTLNQVEPLKDESPNELSQDDIVLSKPEEDWPVAINFRDLAEVNPSRIKHRKVFRCSELFRMDLLRTYNIRTLVDMRKKEDEKETHKVYCELESGNYTAFKDFEKPKVVYVNLIKLSVGIAILFNMPRRIWWYLLKGKLAGMKTNDIMCRAVADTKTLGFGRFYQIIVDKAGDGIAETLRVFVDEKNYPIMIHCTHGKDRTGIITFLLTALCSIQVEDIVEDYKVSEASLREAKLKYKLPLPDVMLEDPIIAADGQNILDLMEHINRKYGSIEGYLLRIGMTAEELKSIRTNLMTQHHH